MEHRALLIRGSLTGAEFLEIIKFVNALHDKRPAMDVEIVAVDEQATLAESEIALKKAVPGFSFRSYSWK